jgi:uncharacterized membrane protein
VTILALATALRLDGIGKSIWLDEASSYLQATGADFVSTARSYDHPPLYFALLRGGLRVTRSFTLLRLFSVVCGVGAVAIFCSFFGDRRRAAGWYAAFLLAVLPGFVDNSQQLRQYALLTLAFSFALMFAWRLVRTPADNSTVIGLGSALAVAACTHLITVFFMLALAAVTFWGLRRERPARLIQVAFGFLPATLLLWFFKSVFLTDTVKSPVLWWMPAISRDSLGFVFGEITGWAALNWVAAACDRYVLGSGTVFLVLAGIGIAFLAWTAWGRASARAARALVVMALIYWVLPIVYSLAVVPVVWPRTMLPGMLPLLLGLGLGVTTHPRMRQRAIASVVTVLLAVALVIPWLSDLAHHPVENLRGLSYTLMHRTRAPDLLVLVNFVDNALEPYWPEYKERTILKLWLTDPLPDTLASLEAARARQPAGSAVLLLYRDDLFTQPRRAVLDEVINHLASEDTPAHEIWRDDLYHVLRFGAAPHSDATRPR